jgi:branched-chain amino acid aminotransferase
MQATRIAQARGADEALLVRPDGIVLEAPTSTIFWVSPEGGLRTPSIGSGILESITRAHIIKALHVEEGEFGLDGLFGTHEAFLASTVREVQPVSAIDDFSLEIPGPRTNEAAEAFQASLRQALAGD